MLPRLEQHRAPATNADVNRARHVLIVLPKTDKIAELARVPLIETLRAALERRQKKLGDLAKTPVATETENGALVAWTMDDAERSTFERQTALRQALQCLLGENPREVAIAVYGDAKQRAAAAELAAYVGWVNGVRLPVRKSKPEGEPLKLIRIYGHEEADGFARARAKAEGNALCRELTFLPPNELDPGTYRARIREEAKRHGWQVDEYDMKRLRRIGAGAFVAVAKGSDQEDAAIVHLTYRPRGAKTNVALVGKGICFDTGGHNLKPAKYMAGMHEDMNGSAVALGILLAATRAKLPVAIDCWLAIAQNHISPRAYKQNDIVTALNGTTIEVVHTDAEGRMVLSDTLTLAARKKPDAIIDFATLTGSMHTALGDRYSGFFATTDELADRAFEAAAASGERLCRFPMDEDYEAGLDSPVADVKQCSMEGSADHILAARLLKRFTEDRPWLHMDLSGSSCKGGLGAVGTDATGFGVAWGFEMLERMTAR